jgi:hypothetical protein
VQVLNGVQSTLATSTQCTGAYTLSFNPTNSILYAACYSGGNIGGLSYSIIAINGTQVTGLVLAAVCTSPYSVAVNSATGTVYAQCQGVG